ncbi:MAG: NADH-quinone oxidoreductase subunit N [Myxococcota bacterium]
MGDLSLFTPEAIVLLGAFVLFAMLVFGAGRTLLWWTSMVFGVGALVASVLWLDARGEPFFEGIYIIDGFSQLLKVAILLGLTLTLLANRQCGSVQAHARADLPFFLFLGTVGLMMLVSATELTTIYVSLELSAYALYIMAALHQQQRAGSEAAIKYVLAGSAASAVSLYGITLIYGTARTTYLAEIMANSALYSEPLFLVGVVFLFAGFLFKLAVFPFHAWAPDAYEGAPHQAVTFIGTASKIGAVGIIIRALLLAPDSKLIADGILCLCVLSMTVGNLAALVQRDLKRLLAYSTVAHAGYLLIGLVGISELGVTSTVFYAIVYLIIAFGPFLVICALGEDGSNPQRDDLSGLYKRSPFLALVLLVGLFGLAGIPPTPGFSGKWFLFAAALKEGQFGLVLVAAVNATISLYYYLILVKQAYLAEPGERGALTLSPAYRIAGAITVLLMIGIGFYPAPLWDLAVDAARAVLFNL